MFNEIRSQISDKCINATVDGNRNKNSEYIFKTVSGSVYKLDFYIPSKKRIIEFDGDYWQRFKQANPARERKRDEEILTTDSALKILHVKECEFNLYKEQTIQTCLNFLND